jgi:hypothetical protein
VADMERFGMGHRAPLAEIGLNLAQRGGAVLCHLAFRSSPRKRGPRAKRS